jgi:hypothetical protein
MRTPKLVFLTGLLSMAVLFFVLPMRVEHAAEQETLRYVILSAGHAAGSEVDTFSPGGQIASTFEFNDRGRGPKIAAHYVLGADGFPSRTDITGNDYLKAPVDEHFAVENGRAHWKSTSEDASGNAGGFYVSNNGPVVEAAILAGALVRAKGGPVKLYPAGEARLEKLTDTSPSTRSPGCRLSRRRFGWTTIYGFLRRRENGSHFCGKAGKAQTKSSTPCKRKRQTIGMRG